jgi:hypothetical protein
MIDAVAHRLGRIIDRARNLEVRLESNPNPAKTGSIYSELAGLQKRAILANMSIGLLTFFAFLIGVTIVVLFLGEAVDFQNFRISVASFLAGSGSVAQQGCTVVRPPLVEYPHHIP